MVITFAKEKKIQRYLIPVFIIIILITAIIIWRGFYEKEKPVLVEVSKPPKEIKINFEVLKNPILENLEFFEKIPSFEGEIGRENPFIPY